MEKIIELNPAYDLRKEGAGIHGVNLRMVLKGKLGAVQFVLFTNWYPKSVDTSTWNRHMIDPLPADKGYHSPKPLYEGQEITVQECEYLDGKPCYYDGSGLNAIRVFDILVKKGSDGVWKELEEYYIGTFSELI